MFDHMKSIRKTVGSDTILLSLSLGKDSIASLILCSMVFKNIHCMFGEQLPTRPRDVAYANYIKGLFPQIKQIKFFPHPILTDYWSKEIYKDHRYYKDPFLDSPVDIEDEIIESSVTYRDYANLIALEIGHDPENLYQAVGVKMSDSLNRRLSLTKMGYINHKEKIIYPIRDFSVQNVYDLLKWKNIKLHPDYEYYGSTFEGMAAKYWVNAYRKDPETWNILKAYYPLATAYVAKDIFKRQMAKQHGGTA